MWLNAAGGDVLGAWLDLPERYPNLDLDVCMVMPDHVHAVIGLGDGRAGRRGLCAAVGAWKALSARRINARRGLPGARVWRRRFRGHLVRGPRELERIRRYVEGCPERWAARRGAGRLD